MQCQQARALQFDQHPITVSSSELYVKYTLFVVIYNYCFIDIVNPGYPEGGGGGGGGIYHPIIFEPISGCVYIFYIVQYLAPLTIFDHFSGHCGTLLGLKGPFWAFMHPKMDPKMYPARQISGDPW